MKIFQRIREIGVVCLWKKCKHYLFPNEETIRACASAGAYEYLERYAEACDWSRTQWQPIREKKIVWTAWWQGEENAPKLVKKCIQQMRQFANGMEVRVITAENVNEYISLPDYIVQKHEKGIIPHAHFVDIIRLVLLKEYGGIWIDSTIWQTDVLPEAIADAELFYLSYNRNQMMMINPFIVAVSQHPFIEDVLSLLLAYWKKEDKLIAYTIMPLFCTMAIRKGALNAKLWEQVPIVYNNQIDMMLPLLGKPFNQQKYDLMKRMSPIHKLTYKFEQYGVDINKKGTFYDVLINGNEPC